MRSSGGIPRRINVLCHNALMLAFAEGEESAAVQHVRDAVHDYDRLLASKASAPVKMAASVSEAIRSASARFARTATTGGLAQAPRFARQRQERSRRCVCWRSQAREFPRCGPFARLLRRCLRDTHRKTSDRNRKFLRSGSPAQFKTRSDDETTKPAPKPISVAPLNVHDGSAGSANELIMRGPAEGPSTTVLPVPEKSKPETNPAANVIPVKLSSAGNISAPAKALASDKGTIRATP